MNIIRSILKVDMMALGVAATVAAALPFGAALAQAFPARPITLVSPYPPGGLNDALSRAVAKGLSDHLGVPVTVANRPGAGGLVGLAYVANAEPDGYTIGMGSNAPLGKSLLLKPGSPYAADDFTYISRVSANNPWLIVSSGNIDAPDLQSVVEYAKANPGTVRYGSIGVGSGSHVAMGMLETESGASFVHVPYAGAGPVVAATLSGEVEIGLTGIGTMLAHRDNTDVTYMAVTSSERNPQFPDVPTTAEAGFPEVLVDIWFGIVGPGGLPNDVTATLSDGLEAALENEAVTSILTSYALTPAWLGHDEFATFAADYYTTMEEFVNTPAGEKIKAEIGQ